MKTQSPVVPVALALFVVAALAGAFYWTYRGPVVEGAPAVPSVLTGASASGTAFTGSKEPVGIANPVSVKCADLGGTLTVTRGADGGESGICALPNGIRCQEQALSRGQCSITGSTSTGAKAQIGMANPASVNCGKKGGTLTIKKRPDGGEYGVCFFEDNRQCEEWALLRGSCPVGGRKVTGYDTEAEIFCAIAGGTVHMENKPVSCELPDSLGSCSADAFYAKGTGCVK